MNNYFVGGVVNFWDNDLKIIFDGDNIVFNGFKFFNIGGVVLDLIVFEGIYDGIEDYIFVIVKIE